jgi:hypothetical protein
MHKDISALALAVTLALWLVADFPGRAVRHLPAPPQTRTSGFPAYGSSKIGFAKCST